MKSDTLTVKLGYLRGQGNVWQSRRRRWSWSHPDGTVGIECGSCRAAISELREYDSVTECKERLFTTYQDKPFCDWALEAFDGGSALDVVFKSEGFDQSPRQVLNDGRAWGLSLQMFLDQRGS